MSYLPSPFSVLTGDGTGEKANGIEVRFGDLNVTEPESPQIVVETRFLGVEPSRLTEMYKLVDSSKFNLAKTIVHPFDGLFSSPPDSEGNPATSLSASIQTLPVVTGVITDSEGQAILNFLKGSVTNSIAQSPTMNMFDGQSSVLMDGSVRPFVVNMDLIENEQGERAIQPVVQSIVEGAICRFQGNVVGETVQLDSTLVFNKIESVDTIEVSAGVAAGMLIQVPRCNMQICNASAVLESGEQLLIDTGINRMVEHRGEPSTMQRVPIVGRLVSDELEFVPTRMLILIRAVKLDP